MANFTEKAIKEAFTELLMERPLSQITVKDIVNACGINRNSFYYHFQDIPALIETIITEEADRIMESYPTIDTMEMGFHAALDFGRRYEKAILHIYASASRDIFEQYLWKVCNYVVASYGERLFQGISLTDSDRELIRKLYSCQCFGMATYWMEYGRKEDVEQEIKRICELEKGMLSEMIKRANTGTGSEA